MGRGMKKKNFTRNRLEILRDEMVMKDRILKILADGPKTILEISALLDYPDNEVTLWVMAMVRYGSLKEMPKSRVDDYYPYAIMD